MTIPFSVDFALYGVHIACWTSFGIARAMASRGLPPEPARPPAPEQTAPWSRTLVASHSLAFGVMYFGIANAVIPGRVPGWFAGQRLVGTLVIAAGAAMMSWALLYLRSWRFRAALNEGHQLATEGPFRFVRHPIYLGLDLVVLGSAIWVPTPTLWVALLVMVIGSDLRGRAEERLLSAHFGVQYSEYLTRTSRFLPGIY